MRSGAIASRTPHHTKRVGGSDGGRAAAEHGDELEAWQMAIGAMVVVAALCANLLQGWDTWSGVDRYYAMFGVTGLLALWYLG